MDETQRSVISDGRYGHAPLLAAGGGGKCYAVWIADTGHGEAVVKAECNANAQPEWTRPEECVPPRPGISGLAATVYRDALLIAWTEPGRSGGLFLAGVTENRTDEPRCLVPGESAPAHPELVADEAGFALFFTVRDGPHRRVEGILAKSPHHALFVHRISRNNARAAHPKAVLRDERAALVWQEMTGTASAILYCTIARNGASSTPQVLLEDRECAAAMPNLAAAPDGFWTAWQWERDTDLGPELVRSASLMHIDDVGNRTVPAVPMPKIERRGRAEDQGFEFPVPLCPPDGRVILLGRGSQSIRRIDAGAGGWSDFMQIDEPGWQCRGRPRTAVVVRNEIWWAAREKGEIVVRRCPLDAGVSGAPRRVPLELPIVYTKIVPEKPRSLIFGGFRVLFGDIHQHTALSDGTGTTEETYFRARVRYGDRVVCVTDHESFLGKRTLPGEWRETCRIADEYYEPGAFVTLNGFEWTGKMHPGPGHKVVYLPPGGGPLLSRDDVKTETSLSLLRECRMLGAVAVPHHVGWTGADMENHEADVQTCWEIVSCHGAYERFGAPDFGTRGDDKEGQFIADALDSNLRFGLVGGSDGHGLSRHHGVSRKQDSHRTGLTGFLSHELTREGVIEALRKRRCFATSGAKIALWFEVDGRPMGEEIITAKEVPFRVLGVAVEPLRHACLVSNGGVEIPIHFDGLSVDAHGTLLPPPDNGFSYYFVRLTQEDGEIAWSSPVWLDPPGPA